MRLKLDFNLVAMLLAAVAVIEGLALFINARQVTILDSDTFTGFAEGTVAAAGLQLMILGVIALLALWLPLNRVSNVYLKKLTGIVPMLCGAILLIEGLLVSYFASPILVMGTDIRIQQVFVAAFGAQLFFLGVGAVLSWIFKSRESMGVALSVLAFNAILSFGLWVVSIAELVVWTDFSGFFERTVLTAGALIMATGLIGLFLNYFEGKAILGKSIINMPIWSWGIVLSGALIAFGGLIGLSIANKVVFDTHGGFGGTTVSMVTFGMFVLGIMAFVPRLLLTGDKSVVDSKVHMAGLFLLLLLPFALLV